MPTVAIVGTEGSGKTVLITSLAKYCAGEEVGSFFMDPRNSKTAKYVAQVWQTLCAGEWPPSTPPGELFALQWTLRSNSGSCDIRLLDIAGQDLRRLFTDDQIERVGELPEQLQAIAEYLNSADIVLFLINLKDFEGEADTQKRLENQWAIKSAMDWLKQQPKRRHFALVFTQADLYPSYAAQAGGWLTVAQQHLNYIYGAHLQQESVPILPVSAISNTKVSAGDHAIVRRVPARPFQPQGFEVLLTWISGRIAEIREQETKDLRCGTPEAADTDPSKAILQNRTLTMPSWIVGIGTAVIVFFWFIAWPSASPSPETTTNLPVPILEKSAVYSEPGALDDWVRVTGIIRNDGAPGKIVLKMWVLENGAEVDRSTQEYWLNQGQTAEVLVVFKKVYSVKNKIDVKYEFVVPASQ